jgi:hypothetical protein
MSEHKTTVYVSTAMTAPMLFISIPLTNNLYILIFTVWIFGACTVAVLMMLYYTVISSEEDKRSISFSLGFNNFMQKLIAVVSP